MKNLSTYVNIVDASNPAPRRSKSSAMSARPFRAARCSGVKPFPSRPVSATRPTMLFMALQTVQIQKNIYIYMHMYIYTYMEGRHPLAMVPQRVVRNRKQQAQRKRHKNRKSREGHNIKMNSSCTNANRRITDMLFTV